MWMNVSGNSRLEEMERLWLQRQMQEEGGAEGGYEQFLTKMFSVVEEVLEELEEALSSVLQRSLRCAQDQDQSHVTSTYLRNCVVNML